MAHAVCTFFFPDEITVAICFIIFLKQTHSNSLKDDALKSKIKEKSPSYKGA